MNNNSNNNIYAVDAAQQTTVPTIFGQPSQYDAINWWQMPRSSHNHYNSPNIYGKSSNNIELNTFLNMQIPTSLLLYKLSQGFNLNKDEIPGAIKTMQKILHSLCEEFYKKG